MTGTSYGTIRFLCFGKGKSNRSHHLLCKSVGTLSKVGAFVARRVSSNGELVRRARVLETILQNRHQVIIPLEGCLTVVHILPNCLMRAVITKKVQTTSMFHSCLNTLARLSTQKNNLDQFSEFERYLSLKGHVCISKVVAIYTQRTLGIYNLYQVGGNLFPLNYNNYIYVNFFGGLSM